MVEHAIARDDWQLAYEAALALDLESSGAVARIVRVAGSLREQGAAEAALDLLSRGLDNGSANERIYLLLVQTLKDVGRFDEALEVLELLKSGVTAPPLAA